MSRQAKEQTEAITRIGSGQGGDSVPSAAEIGGKAWGLLRLAAAGINVPPGFVLGTAVSREFFARENSLGKELREAIRQQLRWLEDASGRAFGSRRNPLTLAVRSGAPVSMPGMMDTLLNVGINDQSVRGLIRLTGNPRLAWDSYRRLLLGYAEIVHPERAPRLEELQANFLKQAGLRQISELGSVNYRELCAELIQEYPAVTGKAFPQDPWQQLYQAIVAVFASWHSARAETYRLLNGIDAGLGTACLVQAMVFGNAGGDSGAGVGFTRNPADGANELYIDYLANAQGEDVVSGRHNVDDVHFLRRQLPAVWAELEKIKGRLEDEFADMQDFEFTVQQGKLYLLQTRDGKRTPLAALRIAGDLVAEKIITPARALARLEGIDLDNLFVTSLAEVAAAEPALGVAASTGVTAGLIALDEQRARELAAGGQPVVLVRHETSTEDIAAVNQAVAVVTVTGGRTSHAAVVARQLGIACVVGCQGLHLDLTRRLVEIGERVVPEGAWLTVDADHGRVYPERLAIKRRRPADLLKAVRRWRAAAGK